MMRRIGVLVLVLLGLCGCGGAEPKTLAVDGLWLTPGQLGYTEQQKWGLPLPREFAVAYLPPGDVLAGQCGDESPTLKGCAVDGTILLRNDLPPAWIPMAMLHEMGHVLRGESGHIESPSCPSGEVGAFVMCSGGGSLEAEPTPEDFDFVLGGWLRQQGSYIRDSKAAEQGGVSLHVWVSGQLTHTAP